MPRFGCRTWSSVGSRRPARTQGESTRLRGPVAIRDGQEPAQQRGCGQHVRGSVGRWGAVQQGGVELREVSGRRTRRGRRPASPTASQGLDRRVSATCDGLQDEVVPVVQGAGVPGDLRLQREQLGAQRRLGDVGAATFARATAWDGCAPSQADDAAWNKPPPPVGRPLVSSAARAQAAAAASCPPRPAARAATASSAATTSSSARSVAAARCQARRSGSSPARRPTPVGAAPFGAGGGRVHRGADQRVVQRHLVHRPR